MKCFLSTVYPHMNFSVFKIAKKLLLSNFLSILPALCEHLGGGGEFFPYGDVPLDRVSFSGFYYGTRYHFSVTIAP